MKDDLVENGGSSGVMTWGEVERPVLKAVLEAEDEDPHGTDTYVIAAVIERDHAEVARAVRRLADAGYLQAHESQGLDDLSSFNIRLRERGLREVGIWPSGEDLLRELVGALDEVAERVDDPDQQGKLRRAGSALGGVAKDVGVQVAAEVTARLITMGGMT